jgi:hypothetical protein
MSEADAPSPEPEFNPQSVFPVPGPRGKASPPPPPSLSPQPPAQDPFAQGQPYPPQAYPQQPGYGQPYPTPPYGQHPGYGQPYYNAAAQAPGQGLYVAAAVINWVVMGIIIVATLGFGIVVAAWFIPMTIRIHKDARDTTKHTALGVCTLLFCNLISGILILVADSDRQPPR